MHVRNLINPAPSGLEKITEHCSDFLEQCSVPLYVNLRDVYPQVARVKVRKINRSPLLKEAMDSAFPDYYNISQRCVFARTTLQTAPNRIPYYIFPINGYQYLYNKQVAEHNNVISDLLGTLDETLVPQVASELMQATYCSDSIEEAAAYQSEVIIYGIPKFYAVRVNNNSYDKLMRDIKCL